MLLRLTLITLLLMCCLHTNTEASWLVYSKPEYKGTLLDTTNEPISGAVVAAIYKKWTMGLGAGGNTSIIEIREVITDKNGSFLIPAYSTIIQPFSTSFATTFIVYKPGYAYVGELSLEDVLSGHATKDMERTSNWDDNIKVIFTTNGIGKLPRVANKEVRKRSIPILPSHDEMLEKQSNILRLINEERQNLGVDKIIPPSH